MSCIAHVQKPIKVITSNILADDYFHYLKKGPLSQQPLVVNNNPNQRANLVANRLLKENPDIMCLQEVTQNSFNNIAGILWNLGFIGYFEKRHSNHPDGCAVFYKRDRFELLQPKPDILDFKDFNPQDSHGRVVQMLHLREKNSKETFWVMNTHIQGGGKAEQPIEVNTLSLVGRVKQHNSHVVVCGDFNLTPQDALIQKLAKCGLKDTLNTCNGKTTYHFNAPERLDFILSTMSSSQAYVSGNFNELMTNNEPSDHLIAGAEFYIPNLKTSSFSPLQTKNPQTAPFRARIFDVFNKAMQSEGYDQKTYDLWMPLFNDALNAADIRFKHAQGDFLSLAKEEILKRFPKQDALFLLDVIDFAANKLEEPTFVNNQMPVAYFNYLINKFNQNFIEDFGNRKFLYDQFLKTYYLAINNAYIQANQTLEGTFLECLRNQITQHSTSTIEKEFLEQLVEAEVVFGFNEVTSTLEAIQSPAHTQEGIRNFVSMIPSSEQKDIFGYVYHIELQAGRNTDHWDFGRVAFLQQEGKDVSDDTRCKAVAKHLLEKTARLFDQGKVKEGLRLFKLLPHSLQKAVQGPTYEIEKSKGGNVGHHDFGRVAFLQEEGWDVSDPSTRAEALRKVKDSLK